MPDADIVAGTLDAVGANTSSGVSIRATVGGVTLTRLVVYGWRVISAPTGATRTSGAVTCTNFDFYIFDRDKEDWVNTTNYGMVVQQKKANAIAFFQGGGYPVVVDDGNLWIRVTNNTSSVADFDIEIWVRPKIDAMLDSVVPASGYTSLGL